MELLDWSIAPDGYIPNSVIRNWKKKEKQQNEPHWKDFLLNTPCHLDEGSTSDEEDETLENIWLAEVEDREEEISFEVKRKRSEKYNEPSKNEVDKHNINRKEGNKREVWEGTGAFKPEMHERNEEQKKAFGERERTGAFKPKMHERIEEGQNEIGGFIQMDSTLSKNIEVFAERSLVPQKREVSLSLKNTDRFIGSAPAIEEIRPHTPQRDLQDNTELKKLITPPLHSQSTPQQSSTIPREWLKFSMVSADAPNSKQGDCATEYSLDSQAVNQQTKINTTAPPVPKPPSPSPEDPPHTLEVCSPKQFPVQHPSFLLPPTKYDNIKDQSQTALDLNVLALYKRFKVHPPILFPQTKKPGFSPTGGRYLPFDDISAGLHGHSRNLRGTPAFIVRLSAIHSHHHSQHHSNIHPVTPCPSHPADDQLTFPQVLCPIRKSSNRPTSVGRKTLDHLVSLQGSQSSQVVGQFAAEHPQEPPQAPQPSVTIPILKRGQAEPFQRVVQKIQLQDGTEPTLCRFSQVIPLSPQQSFVTLHQCGKTQYGKLQFDWTRGF